MKYSELLQKNARTTTLDEGHTTTSIDRRGLASLSRPLLNDNGRPRPIWEACHPHWALHEVVLYMNLQLEKCGQGYKMGARQRNLEKRPVLKLIIADYLHFLSCVGSKAKRWIGLKD